MTTEEQIIQDNHRLRAMLQECQDMLEEVLTEPMIEYQGSPGRGITLPQWKWEQAWQDYGAPLLRALEAQDTRPPWEREEDRYNWKFVGVPEDRKQPLNGRHRTEL